MITLISFFVWCLLACLDRSYSSGRQGILRKELCAGSLQWWLGPDSTANIAGYADARQLLQNNWRLWSSGAERVDKLWTQICLGKNWKILVRAMQRWCYKTFLVLNSSLRRGLKILLVVLEFGHKTLLGKPEQSGFCFGPVWF